MIKAIAQLRQGHVHRNHAEYVETDALRIRMADLEWTMVKGSQSGAPNR